MFFLLLVTGTLTPSLGTITPDNVLIIIKTSFCNYN